MDVGGSPKSLCDIGVEAKVICGGTPTKPDPTLIKAVANALQWAERLKAGAQIKDLAAEAGTTDGPIRRSLKLGFLSPAIVEAIVAGRQPPTLTLAALLRARIPLDWDAQKRALGFAAPTNGQSV
ncbi:MAG: hypothetical protein AAF850_11265 [Pseudomonadota bacterium]